VTTSKNTIKVKGLPKQVEFMRAAEVTDSKYVAYIGGFGSGKTQVLCMRLLQSCLEWPGGTFVVGTQGENLLKLTVIPTWNQVCPTWMWTRPPLMGKLITYFLKGGVTVYFVTYSDYQKIRGWNMDGFFVDEASEISEEAFKMLQARIRDIKGAKRRKRGYIVGNPNGHDWVWQYFQDKGHLHKPEDYYFINAPTQENTFLEDDYAEGLIDSYGGPDSLYARRYVFGESCVFEGTVWPGFDDTLHVVKGKGLRASIIKKITHNSNWRMIAGIDFGWVHPFVYLQIAVSPDKRYYVIGEHYANRTPLEHHAEAIREIDKGIKCKIIRYHDHDAQDAEELKYHGIGNLLPAKKDRKVAGVAYVERLFRDTTPKGPRITIDGDACPNLVHEIPHWVYNEKTGEPETLKEDACSALWYALYSEGGWLARGGKVIAGTYRPILGTRGELGRSLDEVYANILT